MNKILIILEVETETPIHIGTVSTSIISDVHLNRNIDGKIVIPGTSIAGAFRGRATRFFRSFLKESEKECDALTVDNASKLCRCTVCQLFGDINPDVKVNKEETDKLKYTGYTSKLLFHDVEVIEEKKSFIRDGIGIDRHTKTADKYTSAKFDFEVLPVGTKLVIHLEGNNLTDDEEVLMAALIAELKEKRIFIGGKSSRGLGQVALIDVKVKRMPSCTENEIDQFINLLESDDWFNSGTVLIEHWYENRLDEAREKLQNSKEKYFNISGKLVFKDGFLTKDNKQWLFSGFDAIPLIVEKEGTKLTYIQGSTIRGVMRFQAERILRTMLNYFNKEQSETEKLIDKLFGSTNEGSRLKISDAIEISKVCMYEQDHVAIDRFTGGASSGKKFDEVVVYKPQYQLNISIEDYKDWEIGLIILCIRDINDGLITFGAGGSKGYGFAELEDVSLKTIGNIGESTNTNSGVYRAREVNHKKAKDYYKDEVFKNTVDALNKVTKEGYYE